MKINAIFKLPEGNPFSKLPVLVVDIDLEHLQYLKTSDLPVFNYKLFNALPRLKEHHCTSQNLHCPQHQKGRFQDSVYQGSSFEHVFTHVIFDLCVQFRHAIHHLEHTPSPDPRYSRIVVAYTQEKEMRTILKSAVEFLNDSSQWKPFSHQTNHLKYEFQSK